MRSWESGSGKSAQLLSIARQIPWFSQAPSSATAVARPMAGLRNFLTNVVDYVHSPALIGGGVALAALAAAGVWFMSGVTTKANNQVSRIESENARLISEIDRLAAENATLQEGSDRASELNTEVCKFNHGANSLLYAPSRAYLLFSPFRTPFQRYFLGTAMTRESPRPQNGLQNFDPNRSHSRTNPSVAPGPRPSSSYASCRSPTGANARAASIAARKPGRYGSPPVCPATGPQRRAVGPNTLATRRKLM